MEWNYEELSMISRRGKARSVRYLRAAVGPEEFTASIERLIGLGNITQAEVADILKGLHMSERIERAIALVAEHGEITSGQLHAMMGLAEDETPSEVLAEALEYGRLVKDGKFWTLPRDPMEEKLSGWFMPNAHQIAAFPTVPEAEPMDRRSRVEIAIEFLLEQPENRCTNAQMRELLSDCSSPVYAQLHRAIESRKLLRCGSDWILGTDRRTNVEHAVDYLKSHPERRASHTEMCGALGYGSGTTSKILLARLSKGVDTGLLIRAEGVWLLGEQAERQAA